MKLNLAAVTLLSVLSACAFDVTPTALPSPTLAAVIIPTATTTPIPPNTSTPTAPSTLTITPTPTATSSPTVTLIPVPTIPATLMLRAYRILFIRDNHLWSVDLAGKNLQRITPED